MSAEIVNFPGAPFARVEIERLFVREDGILLPLPCWFVSLVEADGGRCFGVFDSPILSEARKAAAEWELPIVVVVDKTGGAP